MDLSKLIAAEGNGPTAPRTRFLALSLLLALAAALALAVACDDDDDNDNDNDDDVSDDDEGGSTEGDDDEGGSTEGDGGTEGEGSTEGDGGTEGDGNGGFNMDDFLAGNCGAIGAMTGPSGACLIDRRSVACWELGLDADTWFYYCNINPCSSDADCGYGWICDTEFGDGCQLPCTTDTGDEQSPECPDGHRCSKPYDVASCAMIPTAPSESACAACIDSCSGLGLPSCCTGVGCMCASECGA